MKRIVAAAAASVHSGPMLLLLLTNAAFFGFCVVTGRILHGSGTDVVSFQFQVLEYARQEILSGRFPLYTPYTYAGHPFFAMGQAGLAYPLNWLLMLPGTFSWIKASVALHALIASLAAYALSCRFLQDAGRSRPGAAWASLPVAVAYAYGGFFVGHAFAGHVNLLAAAAWLPAVWLGLWRLARADRSAAAFWLLLTALALAAMCLAGAPQVVLLTLIPGAGLFLVSLLGQASAPSMRACVERSAAAILALLAAALLAAVQLLPMMELAASSWRGEAGAEALSYSLPVSGLLAAGIPRLWGDPSPAGTWWAQLSRWENSWYLTCPILSLVLLAAVFDARRSLPVIGLGLATLVLALGGNTPVYPWLAEALPLLDSFRVPARFVLPAGALLLLAAGLGLSLALDRRIPARRGGTVLGGTAALLGLLLWGVSRSPTADLLSDWVSQTAGEGAGPDAVAAAAFYWSRDLAAEAALTAALAAFAWALLVRERIATAWNAVPFLCVLLGLWSHQQGLLEGGPTGVYQPAPQVERLAAAVPPAARIVHFEQRGWNKLLPLRIRNIAGYDPSMLGRMARFVNASTFGARGLDARRTWAMWPTPTAHAPSRLWDVVGVSHAIVQRPGAFARAGWTIDARDEPWFLLRNPRAAPAFYCPTRTRVVPDARSAAAAMLDAAFLPGADAAVESVSWPGAGNGPGCSPSVVDVAPERLELTVTAAADTELVAAIQYYPGWECVVDGIPASLAPANLLSTACRVPAGTHRVVLSLASGTFRLGLALTLLSLVVLTAAIARRIFCPPRRRR
jgi:hypothetical protein